MIRSDSYSSVPKQPQFKTKFEIREIYTFKSKMPRQTVAKITTKKDTALPVPTHVAAPAQKKASLTDIIKEGFAFGVGSSVARNVIDHFMAPSAQKRIDTKTEKPAPFEYMQCMQDSAYNHEACKDYLQ